MPNATSNPALKALTDWWDEMGVPADEAILRAAAPAKKPTPQDYKSGAVPERRAKKRRGKSPQQFVSEATALAADCTTLAELKAAIEGFEGCPLKESANKTVVYDGTEGAPVMVIGEGAGGQEDRIGLPFVGKAGQLLDKMLAAIEMSRETNAFITNVIYWHPPGNRNPEPEELAVCRPFVDRMIELGQPKLIIAAGGVAMKTLLQTKTGIMRMRGNEQVLTTPGGYECPLIPIFHPAYLLRRPQDKSRTWRDLLLIQQRLEEMGVEV